MHKQSETEPLPSWTLLDCWRHERQACIEGAYILAKFHGLGWEDICRWTDLGEADARRIVWEVHDAARP